MTSNKIAELIGFNTWVGYNPCDFGLTPEQLAMKIEVMPATPEQRAVRVSDLVTVTVDLQPWTDDIGELWLRSMYDFMRVMPTDVPGLKAADTKAIKPAPEPVHSVLGESVAESDLREALALVRAKNAPQVKETPRGLLTVRGFDHRLGLWTGEV